jgi:hypothetical protein
VLLCHHQRCRAHLSRYHVEIFHLARDALRSEGIAVVAGFLAISSDAWVTRKVGTEDLALPLAARAALCALGSASSDLVTPVPWGEASATSTLRRLASAIAARAAAAAAAAAGESGPAVLPAPLEGMLLCGSDLLARASFPTHNLLCVRRRGDDLAAALDRRLRAAAASAGVTQPPAATHVVDRPDEAAGTDVNSTRARALIRAGRWVELRATGWLCDAVVDRLAADAPVPEAVPLQTVRRPLAPTLWLWASQLPSLLAQVFKSAMMGILGGRGGAPGSGGEVPRGGLTVPGAIPS